jgi:LPXTG-site transpeptidase (sortase) family protein
MLVTITEYPDATNAPAAGTARGTHERARDDISPDPSLARDAGPSGPSLASYPVSVALAVLAVILLSFVLYVAVFGGVEERAAQHAAFDKLRGELANGTGPLGQTDWQPGQTTNGRLLAAGTPVALLEIPAIHAHDVVVEGTSGSALMAGPGHRRDTVLPGQAGLSYILGRAAAYGGPFKRIHDLHKGDRIITTTQDGTSTFKVVDVRRAGDPEPPPLAAGKSRLVLETATGASFMPSGVLLVDADQVTKTLPSAPAGLSLGSLPADEKPLGTDTGTVWALVFWLEAVLILSVGMVWSWHRWGKVQTWIVFVPLAALVGYFLSRQVVLLLPNLM